MEKTKKKMNPIWFLVIGIAILLVPSIIYLCFLIPKMTEAYIVYMSSAGILGGGASYGIHMIPEKTKYGTLFKTATKSFTLLVILTLVKDFIGQILGLIAVFIVSYIIFLVMKGFYKDGKQSRQNRELANEISRSITETTK